MEKVVPDSLRREFDSLHACREPLLIGVRHHSAAIARVLEEILERYQPSTVLVEMPGDFSDWFDLLADQETVAPIAISAVDSNGALAFYPFADFSPELVAIRWAVRHGVPLVACDLSVSARYTLPDIDLPQHPTLTAPSDLTSASVGKYAGLMELLLRRTESNDTFQLWERLVESQAIVANGEEVRRAALTFGWAVRAGTPNVSQRDLLREVAMREAIRSSPVHSAVIVGAFHAPALSPEIIESARSSDREILGNVTSNGKDVGVSLVPYGFDQLDERSGYPAGIRDPIWHQMMLKADSLATMELKTIRLVVELCRAMRKRQQVAGTPDATEVIRMMRGLAQMRRLPIAGRSELLEAVACCLTHGELNGRAREVAKALEQVLVGRQRGRVPPRTPRCGLAVAIEQALKQLGLPISTPAISTTTATGRELQLDVLRSARDRAKGVILRRLCLLGIPYAERVDTVTTGDRENLLERWKLAWQQGTSATIESLGHLGATLEQAVAGMLRLRFWQSQDSAGDLRDAAPNAQHIYQYFAMAAECGMVEILAQLKPTFENDFCRIAGLTELVQALILWGRIEAGHLTALPSSSDDAFAPYVQQFSFTPYQALPGLLLEAALQRLEGLAGSNERQDSAAIADLAYWFEPNATGHFDRFVTWCWQTLEQGGEVMQGTAVGVLAMHKLLSGKRLAAFLCSSFDLASTSSGRQSLRNRLVGVVQVLLPQMLADSSWLAGLDERLKASTDAEFLQRLPALRGAFQEFSPADRQRLLRVNLEPLSDRGVTQRSDNDIQEIALLGIDPGMWLAHLRAADLHAQGVIEDLLPGMLEECRESALIPDGIADSPQLVSGFAPTGQRRDAVISIADRWRMILGIPPQERTLAQRAASRLDDLYGNGSGEGARDRLSNRLNQSPGGGDDVPTPLLAEWSDELTELFGADVCQEVLGEAIAGGNLAATQLLDADQVTPSVELLRQVLSLAGGLAEQRADHLRKLAKKITASLVEQLAIRLRPALNGLATPRPTRRRGRKLHLKRTLHDNLTHIYRRGDGNPRIVAKRLVFQSQSRREMDWHLTFVVDVSGSMSASVVYSAICAAVFAELPALSVRFLAFSTEVIDLSDKVIDPLTLLLEVQVGGGTRIGLGLAAARAQIKVPQRSLVVLVSDFEEGVSIGEMLAEVRALVDSGVRCIGLAALDDTGVARFHQGYASMAAAAGMSVAAVAPEQLARWIGNQIRGSSHGNIDQPVEGRL